MVGLRGWRRELCFNFLYKKRFCDCLFSTAKCISFAWQGRKNRDASIIGNIGCKKKSQEKQLQERKLLVYNYIITRYIEWESEKRPDVKGVMVWNTKRVTHEVQRDEGMNWMIITLISVLSLIQDLWFLSVFHVHLLLPVVSQLFIISRDTWKNLRRETRLESHSSRGRNAT